MSANEAIQREKKISIFKGLSLFFFKTAALFLDFPDEIPERNYLHALQNFLNVYLSPKAIKRSI